MDVGRWGKRTKERWHGCMHSLCVYAVSLTDIAVGGRTAERGQSGKGGGGHEREDEDKDDDEREG